MIYGIDNETAKNYKVELSVAIVDAENASNPLNDINNTQASNSCTFVHKNFDFTATADNRIAEAGGNVTVNITCTETYNSATAGISGNVRYELQKQKDGELGEYTFVSDGTLTMTNGEATLSDFTMPAESGTYRFVFSFNEYTDGDDVYVSFIIR